MKLLENSRFDALTSAICAIDSGDCTIEGSIESYSCKMAGNDKRLFKSICHDTGHQQNDLQALSPPESQVCHSPQRYSRSFSSGDEAEAEGPLCDTISTKTLFYMVSTLNASFLPDYDFSNAKSEEFSKEPSLQWVMNAVDGLLTASMGERYNQLRQQLWTSIDEEIVLAECDIYSYSPDLSSDPFGEEGCIWSFNYFFYNKKMKRNVFFTCRAKGKTGLYGDSGIGGDISNMDDMEFDEFDESDVQYY